MTFTWHKIRSTRPNGLAFFRKYAGGNQLDPIGPHDGRLYVADASGETPDRTDDGEMYLLVGEPLHIYSDSSGSISATATVAKSAHTERLYTVGLTLEEAAWLHSEFGWRVWWEECAAKHAELVTVLYQAAPREDDCSHRAEQNMGGACEECIERVKARQAPGGGA
jgi:hypothetical protein